MEFTSRLSLSLLILNTCETAALFFQLATSCISEVHYGLTVLSSNANGAHEFTVIVCPRCTERVNHCQPLSRPLKLVNKEGGVGWEWFPSDLRWACPWENIHCSRKTSAKMLHHLRDEEDHIEGTYPTRTLVQLVLLFSSLVIAQTLNWCTIHHCHQHYPNTSTNLNCECSKCYMLG